MAEKYKKAGSAGVQLSLTEADEQIALDIERTKSNFEALSEKMTQEFHDKHLNQGDDTTVSSKTEHHVLDMCPSRDI